MRSFKTAVYAVRSPLHDAARGQKASAELISSLQTAFACEEITDLAASSFDLLVVLVMTGGTENLFLKLWPLIEQSGKPFVLAATRSDNSLPASLEILTWLNTRAPGSGARIVHGSPEDLTKQIQEIISLHKISHGLRNQIAGIVGEPSEWLIASMPELSAIEARLGIRFVSISMEQFKNYADKAETGAMSDFSQAFYRSGEKCKTSELVRAAKIYGGLIRTIRTNNLNALTLRCFDILATDQTTGCLALAKLNDDGIPAACEGDVPAMLTMMIIRAVTGKASFMANPSQISGGQVTFAHCTCPSSLLDHFSLNTHFESGIGLAVAGEFAPGDYTVCKLDFSNNRYAVAVGKAQKHLLSPVLCRTQIKLEIAGAAEYFFSAPLGNHHILVPGDCSARLRLWCELMQMKPAWQ